MLYIAPSNLSPHALTPVTSGQYFSKEDTKILSHSQESKTQLQRCEKSWDWATYLASPRKSAAQPGREYRSPGQHAAAQSTRMAPASCNPLPRPPRTSRLLLEVRQGYSREQPSPMHQPDSFPEQVHPVHRIEQGSYRKKNSTSGWHLIPLNRGASSQGHKQKRFAKIYSVLTILDLDTATLEKCLHSPLLEIRNWDIRHRHTDTYKKQQLGWNLWIYSAAFVGK